MYINTYTHTHTCTHTVLFPYVHFSDPPTYGREIFSHFWIRWK
jgi:hypothetical protein